ncbi:ABC transporter permease subunit [Limnobaculum sp. M2-1]|nr:MULTISPECIES: ABC transporter permease subunit [Limnobaculum]MBV7690779.1 ABC transporter permease subunit [Limnobaculum sp. M2-1]
MSNSNKSAGFLLQLATALTVSGIGLIFFMVIAFALPVFTSNYGSDDIELFSWHWNPVKNQFGILPMIAGSVLLSVSAVALAWPLALGLCSWLLNSSAPYSSVSRRLLFRPVAGLVRFMTAVPTVVYGFVAIFLLVPLIREAMGGGSGLNWLSAALVLSLLLLPTMVLVMEAGLRPRMEQLHLTTAALGFNRLQSFAYFVLPQGRRCLLTALVLGFGRGVGDTLIALMLSGNWPQLPSLPVDSLRTLTAHMALVTANEVGGMAYNSLFAAGAILLLINGSVSLALRRLERRADR